MTTERRAQPRIAAEALTSVNHASRTLRIIAVVAAVYVAVVVTVASVIGVVNAFRAADYARQAAEQARANGDIAIEVRQALERIERQ